MFTVETKLSLIDKQRRSSRQNFNKNYEKESVVSHEIKVLVKTIYRRLSL